MKPLPSDEGYLAHRLWFSIPESEAEGRINVMTLLHHRAARRHHGVVPVLVMAIAGISLLVGGIGIMNMMLTNVTERIRDLPLQGPERAGR